ncbi:MAG TPA: VanW family protein, partial [Candidatus Angelobacter sp.]|nr:VanW family protein [Candidatus Angelobacter sp.]
VARAAVTLAQRIVSAPVTVRVGQVVATIPPASLGRALRFTTRDGELVPSLDGQVLRAAVAPALAAVETPGRDASFAIVAGRPVVVPSQVGKGVNPDLLAKDVLTALRDGGTRTIDAEIGTIAPTLTTEQANALGVTEQLSSFTQRFPYAAYRVQNIGTAARRVDGTLLLPGETFSLNDTIGERTPGNGYTKGFVIGPGGVFKEDLGGGVSTSATTVWTAAFYAGLQRVQTQAHSIWIPRYRAGLEATVAWGSFDMRFRNDTPHAVYITTIMRNTSLTVQMWGTKVYDEIRAVSSARYDVTPPSTTRYDPTPTCHAQTGEQGFAIDVYRVFVKGGAEVRREKITTRYRPSPTVVCKADPASRTPTPAATPSGSPRPTASTTSSSTATSTATATP